MHQRARGSHRSKGMRTKVDGASNGLPPSRTIGSYPPGSEKEVSMDRS